MALSNDHLLHLGTDRLSDRTDGSELIAHLLCTACGLLLSRCFFFSIIEGLPLGLGEPWFDGLEPALARGMMAIPGARAVEFSRGTEASRMRGSEHNDAWHLNGDQPVLSGAEDASADGALGGRSTGAPMRIIVHFKPPSSIAREQSTLHLARRNGRIDRRGDRSRDACFGYDLPSWCESCGCR